MQNQNLMSLFLKGQTSLRLHLLSGSMVPHLLPGDELYILPLLGKLRSGDIAVFFARRRFYSHRVLLEFLWEKRGFILEKGDANQQGNLVFYSKAIGKVTRTGRNNRNCELIDREEKRLARKRAFKSFFYMLIHRYIKFNKRSD